MDVPNYIDDLQGNFGRNKTYYLNHVMLAHIPYNVKKVGKIPKKVEDHVPIADSRTTSRI